MSPKRLASFLAALSSFLLNLNSLQAQSCTGAPTFTVNLSGQPVGTWTSPSHSRAGTCCGNSNCTNFEVTLDPGAAMINLEILSGAISSGSMYYQINCGDTIHVGSPVCVTVPSPFRITFCKPGNNPNVYKITSIAKPTFPADATVRLGCTKSLSTLGFNAGSVTWNSIPQWSQAAGFYNNLLSSTTAAAPVYTPTSGLPAYIDYRVCGTPEASICGFAPVCDTVRIYNVAGLTNTVTPAGAGFCAGGSVTLTASASGGSSPYTFIWKNQSNVQVGTGSTYVASSAGIYTLETRDAVYDATTCPALLTSVPVTVTQPPTVNAGTDQTVCTSSPTAYLSGSVTNATGGTWSGGGGTFLPDANTLNASYTPTAGEITAGFVNLTLTSTGAGGGCVNASDIVKITYPPLLVNTLSSYTLSCNASTVNLSPVVSGGVSPYGYSWSNGSAAASITVGGGNYCVTLTDAMGCSATSCGNVTVPSSIGITTGSTDVTVDGGSDGTATATVTGGTTPYTYTWTPSGQTTSTATGLSYGVYTVLVTDANGCTMNSSLVVNEPRCNGFQVSTGGVNVLCHGNNTGSAFASVVGGVGPYTYSWNTSPVQTNVIAVSLTAGVYLVTVTESGGGCIDVASVTITEPAQLTNTMNHTNVSVVGGSDGSATANPAGGNGAYTYTWSTSQTTQAITGLTGGSYTVTVRDANNCSVVDSARVVEPPCNFIVLNVYATDVSCFGGSDGTAAAQMLFGTAPYTYLWSVGSQTTSAISALPTGPVSVLVTDAENCSQFKNVTITEPSVLSLGLVGTDVICNSDNNGTLDLTVSGGTFPYTYLWTNGITVEDQANLGDGSYSVTVTDAEGCTAQTGTSISRPTAISASHSQTSVTCKNGSDGSVDATVSGGISPYTYLWNPGGITTQDISGLAAGHYTLSVSDANNCNSSAALNIFINEPDSVDVDTFIVACPVPGSGVANVDVYPIGGDGGPYQVSFNNGSSYLASGVYTALMPVGATYSVLVKDASGCLSSLQVLTINPEPVISGISFATCFASGTSATTLTVTPGGGAGAPYTVSTNNGTSYGASGNYTPSVPIAGSYNVIVKDSLGCISLASAVVIPDTLGLSYVQSSYAGGYNISCNGLSNGDISLTVSGGTVPYTYSWNSGAMTASTEDLNNIPAGNYSLTVTDANNCSKSLVVSMTQPALLAATTSVTTNFNGSSVSCFGNTNGAVDLTVSGGTTAYTYAWTNTTQTTQDITGLGSGTYVATVTDANGCTATSTVVLTQPALLSTTVSASNYNGQNISCNGLSNGSVDLTVAGGTTAYTYVWTNTAQTTQDITGLSANTYSVLVTDVNGCTAGNSITLTQPAALTHTLAISSNYNGQNISCNGLSNGSIDVTVAGGTNAYTYVWTNTTQTTQDITGLGANTYSVLVTDVNGCTTGGSVTLTQPAPLTNTAAISSNYNGQHVSCFGAGNGGVDLTVAGGTLAYTYAWSNSINTQDLSNITAGTYSVLVTDVNGCTTTNTVTLTQPALLTTTIAVSSNYNGQHISCNGLSDGSIDLSVAGGTTAYTYSWSNTETTQDVSGLSATTYSVLVTDVNGCTATNAVAVTQPSALINTLTITSNYNGQHISCNGLSDGSIDISVAGGTTTYTYQWSGSSSATTQDISGLAAGTYTILITDVNGCTTQANTTLVEPALLTTTVIAGTYNGQNISCNGLSDGSIDLTVAGGTTAYTYQWSGSSSATSEDLSALAAGTYSILVTDVNGCTAVNDITLIQPAVLTTSVAAATYNGQNISCNGLTDGSIDLSVAGGTTAYTYQWSNLETTEDVTGLGAGSYSVVVTDVNGCSSTSTITLTQPAVLTTTLIPATFNGQNISCNGLSDGSIDLAVAGGTTAYTYSWSNAEITEDITGLNANTYSVLVSDVNGCTAVNSVTLTEPALLTANAAVSSNYNGQHISCNGLTNGSVDLTVAGGTTAYTYSWSNAGTTQDITGLGANTYSVLVTDVNGCTATQTIVVTEPAPLTTSVAVSSNYNGQHISCNGLSDGSIDLTVAGGTTNYTYFWSTSATTEDITGLAANNYFVQVTDVNGCTSSNSITVTQPAPLTNTIAISSNYNGQPISCNGLSDGSIDLSVAGGTANYTYSWSNAETTEDITGLNANTYTVLVTDVNGCTTTNSITVTQPVLLTNTIAVSSNYNGQNISCNGLANGSIDLTVAGGTTGYTYQWENMSQTTQDVSGLSAGTYSVLVTDVNGCTTTNTITLTQPALLTNSMAVSSNYNGQNISCNGLGNGSIDLTVAGGTTNYTYAWSNGQITQDINGLFAGTYSVLVTDVNGCTTTNTITLTQPAALTSTIAVSSNYNGQHVSCNGLSDGSVDLSVSGGTTNYTYSWSNAQSTQDISGLSAGGYSVLVTDVNGCTTTNTILLNQPAPLTNTIAVSSNYNGQNISCNGLSDGSVDLSVSGGTTNYTYSWSNSQTTQDISGLAAGSYSVTVTDVNGCTTTNTITLTQPGVLADTMTTTDVLCNGDSTGTATVIASAGTTPYTYLWSANAAGQTTATATGLAIGTYTVLVTDVNSCSKTDTIVVSQPTALADTLSVSDVLCNGGNTGSASVLISGGLTPYTYAWSNSQTTAGITGLTAGQYIVTATDSNGCVIIDTAIVGQPAALADSLVVTSLLCNSDSSGTASVIMSGGMTPYTYLWTNAQTTSSVTGLAAGAYSVTVTDSNGCVLVVPVMVTQPAVLTSVLNSTVASCNGGSDGTASAFINGGTAPYTYLWSANSGNQTTSVATGLTAGNYIVSVVDSNGCALNDSVTVSQNSALAIAFSSQDVTCYGASNGSIDMTVAGGITPYTYAWSNGATTQDLSGLPDSTYVVTVLDANQCVLSDTITLSEPDSLWVTLYSTTYTGGYNVSVFQGTNGSIDATAGGGTPGYTYFWTNGSSDEDLTGLTAGSYTLLVTDANGCTHISYITLTEPFEFAMPGGISPNGDDKNDAFVIHGLDIFESNNLQVFNRWGDVVYSMNNYQNDWKGTNQSGVPLPDGTYFVVLKVNGGEKTLTGYVDVRR